MDWIDNPILEVAGKHESTVLCKLFDSLNDYLEPRTVPQAILILADYQHKSAFVADHEINMTACLVELMMECEYK